MTTIIILALIAIFIGLRLYSVLGERTGHEQPILKPADPEARIEQRSVPSANPSGSQFDGEGLAFVPTAGPGVRALLSADPSFDVARFLEGAKAAYRMVLEAFWASDLEPVRTHVDADVLATFQAAVDQRAAEGHRLDNRLVAVDRAVIVSAALERTIATITVRFEADVAAVTRDKDGHVVAGSLSDAVQTRDLWTFRRDLSSRDPNWLLIETDEEE